MHDVWGGRREEAGSGGPRQLFPHVISRAINLCGVEAEVKRVLRGSHSL